MCLLIYWEKIPRAEIASTENKVIWGIFVFWVFFFLHAHFLCKHTITVFSVKFLVLSLAFPEFIVIMLSTVNVYRAASSFDL